MRPTIILALAALFATTILALFLASRLPDETVSIVSNATTITASISAALAFFLTWKRIPQSFIQERRSWLQIGLALLLFTIGDAYWGYSEVILGVEVPIGGLCDLCWTFGYILLITGTYQLATLVFHKNKNNTAIFTLFAALAIGYAAYSALHLPAENTFALFINNLYVSYDLLLLGIIIPLIVTLAPTANKFTWIWVLLAGFIALRVVFDFLFAGLIALDAYGVSNPIDLIYIGTYFVACLAADKKYSILPHD